MGFYNRLKTWTKEKLLAADLNAEFDAVQSAVNEIETAQIANGAITGPKLADAAITFPKIADSQVTGSKIADEAISTAKIQDGAVTSEKLSSEAINGSRADIYVSGESGTIPHQGTATFTHGLLNPDGTNRTPKIYFADVKFETGGNVYWGPDDGVYARATATQIIVYNDSGTNRVVRAVAW